MTTKLTATHKHSHTLCTFTHPHQLHKQLAATHNHISCTHNSQLHTITSAAHTTHSYTQSHQLHTQLTAAHNHISCTHNSQLHTITSAAHTHTHTHTHTTHSYTVAAALLFSLPAGQQTINTHRFYLSTIKHNRTLITRS